MAKAVSLDTSKVIRERSEPRSLSGSGFPLKSFTTVTIFCLHERRKASASAKILAGLIAASISARPSTLAEGSKGRSVKKANAGELLCRLRGQSRSLLKPFPSASPRTFFHRSWEARIRLADGAKRAPLPPFWPHCFQAVRSLPGPCRAHALSAIPILQGLLLLYLEPLVVLALLLSLSAKRTSELAEGKCLEDKAGL